MKKDSHVTPPVPDPVDRLLRQTLGEVRPAESHVDAEQLAAWSARTLPADAMSAIEAHLSICDRCQQMLAVFARIEPAPAPVTSLWQRWRLAWIVPATAAAAATLTWIAWPGPVPVPPAEKTTIAQAEPPQRVVVAPEPQIGVAQPAATAAARADAQKQDLAKMADARVETRDQTATASKSAANTAPPGQQGQQGQMGAATPLGAVATPPPLPQAKPMPSPVSSTISGLPALTESIIPAPVIYTFSSADPKTVTVDGAVPSSAGAGRGAAGGRGGGGGRGGAGAAGGVAGGAAAPPPAVFRQSAAVAAVVRWRILASGVVERSIDDGATWTAVPLNLEPPARVTRGAAPVPSACWLIGPRGLVLLSTDAERFERVKFPEAVDLTAISAYDARTARVTTADGRVFVTADGGGSWKREQQ